MRRTQLYLDDQLWTLLHVLAGSEKTTVSELVRQAIRERYLGDREQRRIAMQQFVGMRRTPGVADASEEVRILRRGSRLDRLASK